MRFISALECYAYDLNFAYPDPAKLPAVTLVGAGATAHLAIVFQRRTDGADLLYRVEANDNMENWIPIATLAPGEPAAVQAGGYRRL